MGAPSFIASYVGQDVSTPNLDGYVQQIEGSLETSRVNMTVVRYTYAGLDLLASAKDVGQLASAGVVGVKTLWRRGAGDGGVGSSLGMMPGGDVVPNNTPNTLVIGRVDDLQGAGALKPGEFTLLPRMVDDLGTPRANWERNSTLLRQEMRAGNPIRDASAHKPDSFPVPTPLNPDRTVRQTFTGMERNILQNRGWTFDGQFWRPPVAD